MDNYRYAGLPVDELVFFVAEVGMVRGVRSPGLREGAKKLRCGLSIVVTPLEVAILRKSIVL